MDIKHPIIYCQQEANFNDKVINILKEKVWVKRGIYHAYKYQRKLEWLY